jgi:hypothetical protein
LAKRYGRSSIAATRGSNTSSGSFNAVYKPTISNRKHAIDWEGVVDSRNAVTGSRGDWRGVRGVWGGVTWTRISGETREG